MQSIMKRGVFEMMDPAELGWACMASIMEPLRGKSPSKKLEVYLKLTSTQQVLFMFYAYYNHAKNSIEEFSWWSSHYLAHPKMWSEIKARLTDFGEEQLLDLLEEIEDMLKEEIDGSLLSQYSKFHEITPMTLKRIGEYIRIHPNEFVLIEE